MEYIKRILIVDDSDIDRSVLKSILDDDFEVLETDNGYSALEIILKKKENLDAVLLDVSMPLLDGLSVLRILRENYLDEIPVFMITAEATKDNIEKASQYHIAEFIKKPFNREDILNRVRAKLGVVPKTVLTKADIDETKRYIAALEGIYNRYLKLAGKDRGRDERRAHFMKILLERHPFVSKELEADSFRLEMLCRAAYLCNIGEMLVQNIPEDEEQENGHTGQWVNPQHTVMGADMIQLNSSKHCRRFVQLCADMCLHHHERYDGNGFPQGIGGGSLSIYAQICGLLERFDDLFFPYSRHNELQFDYVIHQLKGDAGFVSEEILSLLIDSKSEIIEHYTGIFI